MAAENDDRENLEAYGAEVMHIDAVDDAKDNPAHRAHEGGNGPGEGENPSHVDSQGQGRRLVARHRSHVDALRGILEEDSENDQKKNPDDKGRHIDRGNGHGPEL